MSIISCFHFFGCSQVGTDKIHCKVKIVVNNDSIFNGVVTIGPNFDTTHSYTSHNTKNLCAN